MDLRLLPNIMGKVSNNCMNFLIQPFKLHLLWLDFISQNIVSFISILCLTEIMFIRATYHKIVVKVFHYCFRPLAVNLSICNTAIMHVGTSYFLIVISILLLFLPLFTFVIQLMHLQRDPFLKHSGIISLIWYMWC